MPTLNILKKTKKEKNQREEHTSSRELRRKHYNTTEWRKLRETYIKQHPICEECLAKGKITPAEDIHHKISPFKDGECNKTLFLDYNNLQALCKQCHSAKHNNPNKVSIQDVIKQLADLMDENKTDKELEDDNQ